MKTRLLSIIRKEFIQIFRDPRTLALIIVMPIIQLFLLGYAATTDVKNISIAYWDQSRSPESRALLDVFRAADYFNFAYEVQSDEEIATLIEGGDVRGALIIPPDYARKLLEGKAQVSLILDGSDATVGATAHVVASTATTHANLVQPRSALRVFYDPRRDRHGAVCHFSDGHSHCGCARTRARHYRATHRHAHSSMGIDRRQNHALCHPRFFQFV